MEALKIENLSKAYEGFALQNINLTLPGGCIMGFIGENGAGKSSTIKAALSLVQKDSGKISFYGQEFDQDDRDMKEQLGVVFDHACFSEEMKAKEIGNIMMHMYRTWDKFRFEGYIKQFRIPEKKAIKQYSRGMKMKLCLAVALSHDTKLLILDEATSGLDPVMREQLFDIFREFIQDEEHSILISSHILSDLEKICDYITFIHNGRIVLSESKDDLLESYRIVKCSKEELEVLDSEALIGTRINEFCAEALVKASGVPKGMTAEKATMEDIMIYHIKEA